MSDKNQTPPQDPPNESYVDEVARLMDEEGPATPPEPPKDPPPAPPAPPKDPPPAPPAPPKDDDPPLPPPIKKEEPKPDELEDLTKNMSVKAADRFKAIHARAAEAEKRAKELESQINEFKTTAPPPEEVEKLKQRVAELDEIVQKTALTDHPEFRSKFDNKIANRVEAAKNVVGQENAALAERVMNMNDSPERVKLMEELTEGMSAYKITRLTSIVDEVDSLLSQRNEAVSKWKDTKAEYLASIQQQSEQSVEAYNKQIGSIMNTVLREATDENNGIDVFMRMDGNEKWNQEVDARVTEAQKLLRHDLPVKDKVQAALKAAASDKYRQLFYHYFSQTEKLSEQLKKIQQANPNLDTTGTRQDGDDRFSGAESFIDAVEQATVEAGLIRNS